jgi:L-2-hydroxyglutarate oxidase LhgO
LYKTDITIIGAGVIGLAIAAELSTSFKDVVVLEKSNRFGLETSSRNSEVMHSGIYYPEGSLKAILCVEGVDLLYKFCYNHSISYRKTGKLIVAAEESELGDMEKLYQKGIRNGVRNIRHIDKHDIEKIEPMAKGIAGIYLADTGIIDSHGYMNVLYNIGRAADVSYIYNSEADYIDKKNDGFIVGIKKDGIRFSTRVLINASGLSSDYVAELAGINVDESDYRLDYFKGSYFSYGKKSPVKMLVYPLPQSHLTGLGVHATIDMGGRLRFGPDTEHVTAIDYDVDSTKKKFFYESACRIIKNLDEDCFYPDMAGIRPKLKGEGARDFVINHEKSRGLDGLINLIGIESPGLTSSIAIAKKVKKMVVEIMA